MTTVNDGRLFGQRRSRKRSTPGIARGGHSGGDGAAV